MKFIIAIISVLFAVTASAWEVEASIGTAQAGMPPDGQYWQQPFSHQFQLQGQAASPVSYTHLTLPTNREV